MRDWSSTRVAGFTRSSPCASVVSSCQLSELRKNAPPPGCCHAPVIAGRQVTACIAAEPLRVRVKPKPTRRKRARGAAVEPCEGHDLLDRQAGDGGRPLRRLVGKMRLDLGAEVGVTREISAVGEALLQQHVHHREGQGGVGARAQHQPDVGRLDSGRAINVHDHELGAALLAGLGNVGHGIDLRRHGIAAPHDDEVGRRHLARIRPQKSADAGTPARLAGVMQIVVFWRE